MTSLPSNDSTPTAERVDSRIAYQGAQPMDPEGIAIRAIFDPRLFVERRFALHEGQAYAQEEIHRWQAHAVIEALKLAGYDLTPLDGAHVTEPRPHAQRVVPVSAPDCGCLGSGHDDDCPEPWT